MYSVRVSWWGCRSVRQDSAKKKIIKIDEWGWRWGGAAVLICCPSLSGDLCCCGDELTAVPDCLELLWYRDLRLKGRDTRGFLSDQQAFSDQLWILVVYSQQLISSAQDEDSINGLFWSKVPSSTKTRMGELCPLALNLMFSLFNKNPKSNYTTNLLKDAQFKEHFMV